MEVTALVFGILGCVFGFLGLAASFVTGVIVWGWKNSTHKIEYVRPEESETVVDAPPAVQAAIAPEDKTSLKKWLNSQEQNLFDAASQMPDDY